MPPLVRALAAFGVAVVASLSAVHGDVGAQTATGCTLVQSNAGPVSARQNVTVVANCPGIDPKATEFIWQITAIDKTGARTFLSHSGAVVGLSTLTFRLPNPGEYEIQLYYREKGSPARLALSPPLRMTAGPPFTVSLRGTSRLQLNERTPMVVQAHDGVPPYRLTVSIVGGGSRSGNFTQQSRPNGPYDTTQFFFPTPTPGDKEVTVAVTDTKGNSVTRTIIFGVTDRPPEPRNGVDPLVGSYSAKVTGSKPPDTNTYWAHVVGHESDGTRQISLYAHQDNYHINLFPDSNLHVSSGANGSEANGRGSVAGNGGIGTTITMQWTLSGSDGKPTAYTWVLTKYDNRDLGGPQPGFAR